MNLIYNVMLKKIGAPDMFNRCVLSKDANGESAEQRAVTATITAAGAGTWVVQNVNLVAIDIDLTV